jgi:hypothetical protein
MKNGCVVAVRATPAAARAVVVRFGHGAIFGSRVVAAVACIACACFLTHCVGDDGKVGPADATADQSVADAAADGLTECTANDLRCKGNTPQQCVGGAWQDQAPCGGSTPTCSNGVCSAYRMTGGVRSITAGTRDGGMQLVAGGFEWSARTCDEAGVCVAGGIVP